MSDIKELIKSKLRPIGDAIREKNGSTELIPIDDMPQAIRDIQGGGGGIVEVTELPSVGKANTVYKLIHKNVGTEVPTTGLIENYYLNVSLSINEVVDILSQLTYQSGTDANTNVVFQTDNHNIICYQVDGAYAIKADNAYVFASNLTLAERLQCSSIGWNVAYITEDWTPKTPVAVNETTLTEEDLGMPIGAENDKVINLFSITPFEEKIPSEMYYLFENSEWQQISGGILEVDKLPTSGEDNYVYALKKQPTYDVYVNEKEQGISNLTELAKQSGGKVEVVAVVNILPTENIIVSPSDWEMNLYYIKNDGLYVYADFTGDGNVTWHNFADAMVLSFSGEVTSESDMTVADSLYLLSSGGDSANYYIYEKGEPIQVPNSGLIENLYFNTKLSNEEVDNILSQLTYDINGHAYIVGGYEKGSVYGNIIIVEANAFTQGQIPSGYIIGHMHDTTNMASTEFIYMSNQGLVDLALTLGINTKVGWNMETLSLNQEFIGEYGTENDKLINVISTTPYPHWSEISGGATVKATPEVVPNTGYIERVYLNKSLTFDEVNAICTKANNLVANELLKANVIACNKDVNKLLAVTKFTDTDDTNVNVIVYPSLATVIWSEKDYYHVETSGTITQWKKGWNIEEDYLEFNDEVVAEANIFTDVTCGTYNDQLTELFSINNVFKTEEIELTESYDGSPLVLSNKYVKKTVVPNEGYVERVYLNTALSIDEVKAILEKFYTYYDGDNIDNMFWLINIDDFNNSSVTPEKLHWIMASRDSGDYAIVNALSQIIFKSDSSKWIGGDFVGWNPEFITAEKPYLEINSQVFPIVTENGKETKVGGFNDKIVDLFSLTPFEEKIYDSVEVDVKSMLEEKKLPLSINVNVEGSINVVKSGGTVVPNNAYIENVYFNTNLSVEEVVNILEQLTYNETNRDYVLVTNEGDEYLTLYCQYTNNIYSIHIRMKRNGVKENSVLFTSVDNNNGFTGWNPNITYPIVVNDTAEPMDIEEGVLQGTQNDKLTQLFSITMFGNQVIKTLEGDYEAVDIVVNELPSVWQGTEVPNDEYIENIYFNTKLSIEEVDNILDRIDYTDNIYGIALVQESENTYLPLYVERGEKYGLSGYAIRYTASLFIFVSNQEIVDFISDNLGVTTKVGWNIENSLLSVYRDVVPSYQDNTYGTQNDKLSSLVSVSEFILDNTIDLEQYLDNKQMPLSIKVNVESQEPNLQEKEITENGEYVADSGYDGFRKVTVNVESSGGEDRLKKLLDTTQSTMQLFNNYQGKSVDDLIKYDDTENVTTMENMFMNCKNLTKIPQLNTSKVTSMQYMFYQCNALTEIQQLDTSKVTNMKQMFYYCNTLKTIPELDTSKVTNMQNMFMNCKALTTIPQLDTSKVTSMDYMFNGCSVLKTIPQLDTSKVTNMKQMFYNCWNLTEIPQLNTSKVTDMNSMLFCASSGDGNKYLKTITLTDTSNVTNMNSMFWKCRALETISKLDMIKISDSYYVDSMFMECMSLTNLTLLNIKVNLKIGSGDGTGSFDWGHLLTLESLINTVKELINVGKARTLTMGSANLSKIASTYVKFTDTSQTTIPKNEKGDVVVCESTDTGAMLLSDYALLKNWTLS